MHRDLVRILVITEPIKMPFTPAAYPGSLHHYAPRLVAFEHAPASDKAAGNIEAHNFVLFVGGLCDALMTVKYPSVLATVLPSSWAVAEVQTRSSGVGFTTGSLERDSEDLAKAITYFRDVAKQRNSESPAKVILLGHSTGCQDAMNYIVGPWKQEPMPQHVKERPPLDGVILQAGISDREGVEDHLDARQVQESLKIAEAMIQEGRGLDHMPLATTKGMFGAQPSAERWTSLLNETGDDDYFSSDLSDDRLERVWGAGGLAARAVKVMVLLSGEDENMPKSLNKAELISKWETFVKGSNGLWDDRSGVLERASHNLNKSSDSVVNRLCETVLGFVQSIDPHLAHKDTGKL